MATPSRVAAASFASDAAAARIIAARPESEATTNACAATPCLSIACISRPRSAPTPAIAVARVAALRSFPSGVSICESCRFVVSDLIFAPAAAAPVGPAAINLAWSLRDWS